MSEVTTDPTQLDALAGEFVLGTLDTDERSQAQALFDSDQSFAARVKLWERRLGELHLMVEPVEPDGKLWERIKEKVPQAPPVTELKLPETPAEAAPPSAPEPATAETAPAAPDAKPAAAGDETPALPPAPTIPPKPEPHKAEPSLTPPPVAPALNRAPPPPASTPPVLTPTATRTPQVEAKREGADATATIRGRLGAWRAFAVLMTLVVVAVAALLAAWRFVPERVPPVLQPAALMRLVGVPIGTGAAPRPPAPPESQYDE
jgi:anti-sigma-K factor RskA